MERSGDQLREITVDALPSLPACPSSQICVGKVITTRVKIMFSECELQTHNGFSECDLQKHKFCCMCLQFRCGAAMPTCAMHQFSKWFMHVPAPLCQHSRFCFTMSCVFQNAPVCRVSLTRPKYRILRWAVQIMPDILQKHNFLRRLIHASKPSWKCIELRHLLAKNDILATCRPQLQQVAVIMRAPGRDLQKHNTFLGVYFSIPLRSGGVDARQTSVLQWICEALTDWGWILVEMGGDFGRGKRRVTSELVSKCLGWDFGRGKKRVTSELVSDIYIYMYIIYTHTYIYIHTLHFLCFTFAHGLAIKHGGLQADLKGDWAPPPLPGNTTHIPECPKNPVYVCVVMSLYLWFYIHT